MITLIIFFFFTLERIISEIKRKNEFIEHFEIKVSLVLILFV
jgi:hypothetical protein